jgi:ribosomal protein S18 acetylase RimI-like enzyme
MTLAAESDRSGPRPLDLRRDLKQVAALIEEAFGPELDAAGWAALRELRMAARLGPLLHWLTPSGQRADYLNGFVWIEDGQLVGNVTVQRLHQFPSRYIIANVAVQAHYRGRGIASELMRLALDYIVQQGGTWAMLQVREDNDIALGMYQRLGFAPVMTEHRLLLERLSPVEALPFPQEGELRPLGSGHRTELRYLLSRALPRAARWWHPYRHAGFREGSSSVVQRSLSRWLNVGHRMRWGLFLGGELQGVLDVDVFLYDQHRVDLLLYPELRAMWSAPLLSVALAYLQQFPARPVQAVLYDYQQPAIEALRAWGFQPFVTLVNMRKRLRAEAQEA